MNTENKAELKVLLTKEIEAMKELIAFGFNREDLLNVFEKFEDENDFCVETDEGEYRFIEEDIIDEVLKEELSNDTYILGCFSSWFIADVLNIPMDSVEKIQKAEGYQALGEMMLNHIDEVAIKYASTDGYGHHFSSYDHSEELLSNGYYMFRVN